METAFEKRSASKASPPPSGKKIVNSIASPTGLSIHYRGASLDKGKLPAFFYFALSSEDSLNLDPFNQPVTFLDQYPLRIFSFSIPGHGEGLKNTEAMKKWAKDIKTETDPLTPFFKKCLKNIDFLIDLNLIDEKKLAVGGLSRGGFIALHLASLDPRLRIVLGFSPLTTTTTIKEFSDIQNHPIIQSYTIKMKRLIGKKIRFYIGNHDQRVGTDACYHFIRELTNISYSDRIRSPEIELIISPSIGHKGHGTSLHIFKEGAEWIASLLTENSL